MNRKILLLIFFLPSISAKSQWLKLQFKGSAQGTTYNFISFVDTSSIYTLPNKNDIDSIFTKIEHDFSLYNANSLINQFNNSITGIRINADYKQLFNYVFLIYKISNHLFDPTILPLKYFWLNIKDSTSVNYSGYTKSNLVSGLHLLRMTNDSLIKFNSNIKIDLDGIAQGYSVDKFAQFFESKGVFNYLIEIGGEIRFKGIKKNTNEEFIISLPPIDDRLDIISLTNNKSLKFNAITSSGSISKNSFNSLNKEYINPKTRKPTKSNIVSVSIFAENATIADGFDNVIMLMNHKGAIDFLKKHPFINARIVYRAKKKLHFYFTAELKNLLK